jgi:hypothetical protein
VNGLADAVAVGDLDHCCGLGRYRWVVERTSLGGTRSHAYRFAGSTAPTSHEAFLKLACCLICW